MLAKKLMGSAGGTAVDKLYVDDVFSTYLYTGNGSTQTINNGIDLAGEGGLVWGKDRSNAFNHFLVDTVRGAHQTLFSNSTGANQDYSGSGTVGSFSSTGFNAGSNALANNGGDNYVSWTFRRAERFFDVVTYTGNGVAGRQIPHGLGVAPGMMIVKATNLSNNWIVYHRSLTYAKYLFLNLTGGETVDSSQWIAEPTSTNFTVGNTGSINNANGITYIAYLFAHDPSADGIVQCGSFTTDGSGNATVNLGWEPQFLLYKGTSSTFDWSMVDAMRGFSAWGGSPDAVLSANLSDAEDTGSGWLNSPIAVGFDAALSASSTYIYLAIRRPNKPPTSGTQVYNAIARTGTGAVATVTAGFAPDCLISSTRTDLSGFGYYGSFVFDRLRGPKKLILTSNTDAEATNDTSLLSFDTNGVTFGSDSSGGTYGGRFNRSGNTYINHFFKRAPGFFDVVCYTGNGVTTGRTVAHNLGVTPDLVISKVRSLSSQNWPVWSSGLTTGNYIVLDLYNAQTTASAAIRYGNGVATVNPTSSVITVGSNLNSSGATYVSYLFASLPGIQYINSYVGDGTTGRTINCGFSAGARFVCIKATSTTGSWWIFDSSRGIVSAADPALQLNYTAAEITSADAIDPTGVGFIVNQETTCNLNVNGVSYLVWAIA